MNRQISTVLAVSIVLFLSVGVGVYSWAASKSISALADISYNYGLKIKNQKHACTQEAKICPDGSSVGRSGPKCEFAPCPEGIVGNDRDELGNAYFDGCGQYGGVIEENDCTNGYEKIGLFKEENNHISLCCRKKISNDDCSNAGGKIIPSNLEQNKIFTCPRNYYILGRIDNDDKQLFCCKMEEWGPTGLVQ